MQATEGANDAWKYGIDSTRHESSGQLDQQQPRQPHEHHLPASFPHTSLGSGDGFASFPESGSMVSSSEYPLEPSTAPTSRASEWKFDPITAGMGTESNQMNASQLAQKRRRDSFDSRAEGAGGHSSSGSNSMPALFSYQQASRDGDEQRQAGARPLHQGPLVPSQGHGGMHARSRIASWGGEQTQYVDDWSFGSGHGDVSHMQGMSSSSTSPFRPDLATTTSGGMASRIGQFSVDLGDRGGRHSSQGPRTDMVHVLGSAMDASIESDGVAKCPYPNCTKTFAKNRSYNLKAHLRSHSQLKPYQCTHCPRAFSRKHDLERHSRVHVRTSNRERTPSQTYSLT